jgi:hypothetical protein
MGTTAADMQKLFGRAILFIFRTQTWTIADFQAAAQFARSLGFDTISPKRGEGTVKWYNTPAQLAEERKAVLGEGVGYAPFLYCDGPKFGLSFVPRECDVLKEMGDANDGAVVADMETEWDGQEEAATLFEEQMRPWPGVLGVTTWADPADQNWLGVAQALAPAVNLWIPQRYDNWLAAQVLPGEETIVQPALDLSQEFGPNAVASLANHVAAEGESAWIWEYVYAQQYPALVRQITSVLHAGPGEHGVTQDFDHIVHGPTVVY